MGTTGRNTTGFGGTGILVTLAVSAGVGVMTAALGAGPGTAVAAMLLSAGTRCFVKLFGRELILLTGRPLVHLGYRLRVCGGANVPEEGGALLVCNHVSYMDPVLIQAAVRRPIRFLMYRRYYEKWWLHAPCSALGVIPVASDDSPRDLLKSLRHVRELIAAGEVVCVFAEGGVTRDGSMKTFQRGTEVIMRGIRAPIVPMALCGVWGTFMSFVDGHLLKRLPFREAAVLSIGEPMHPSSSAADIERHVRSLALRGLTHEGPAREHEPLRPPTPGAIADSSSVIRGG